MQINKCINKKSKSSQGMQKIVKDHIEFMAAGSWENELESISYSVTGVTFHLCHLKKKILDPVPIIRRGKR